MRFRPCIDIHEGKVKQIVGSTLRDTPGAAPSTNFEAEQPPSFFADLYFRDGLAGGHVIMLGKGNEAAARNALSAHPGTLQVGGGITPENAAEWLVDGASKVIVTSYLFVEGTLSMARLETLANAVSPERLVIDLSCHACSDGQYRVACDRWQTITNTIVNNETLSSLACYCSEYLVHAVDVEGKQAGIDDTLVRLLAAGSPIPVTYAGGAKSMEDIHSLQRLGQNRIDVTVGSALDIFGGHGIRYRDLVDFDRKNR
ncbi:MAG: phosphoribosylformimino-5-aminoimidazole carboxamide ribotide isomerase [Victivallales bacterium]|nr:phosphoribosylformimino-5-aminoimidazole carboxamide ribotide isomerase [Victivallales bacterium]